MSFKIVRFNCCGMDVHKDIVVATIGITDPATLVTTYFQESFSTFNSDLYRMCDWLASHNCSDTCMESTGKYWIPVFNILEERGFTVCLTHPKYVKAIKGKKTDKKDSKWICDLYKLDLVRKSFIPPKPIRELREIARYYHKLVGMNSSESRRYQNCLTVSNLGIGSIFTDVNGKSAQRVMKAVLESESPNDPESLSDEDILKLVHKSCKKKDRLLDAIRGCRIEPDQRFKMSEVTEHKKELDQHIANCLAEMFRRALPYFDQFLQITEIPGISAVSAILIISEIGVDMTVWENAGQYLKPLLVQCALAAVKNPDGYFGIKYRRIMKLRGHKKAIIAIARMMLKSVYHMILTGESFNPSDFEEVTNPKPRKPKNYTVESAVDFLKSSGADIDKIIASLKEPPRDAAAAAS